MSEAAAGGLRTPGTLTLPLSFVPLCAACREGSVDMRVLECGHIICSTCRKSFEKPQCIMCREIVGAGKTVNVQQRQDLLRSALESGARLLGARAVQALLDLVDATGMAEDVSERWAGIVNANWSYSDDGKGRRTRADPYAGPARVPVSLQSLFARMARVACASSPREYAAAATSPLQTDESRVASVATPLRMVSSFFGSGVKSKMAPQMIYQRFAPHFGRAVASQGRHGYGGGGGASRDTTAPALALSALCLALECSGAPGSGLPLEILDSMQKAFKAREPLPVLMVVARGLRGYEGPSTDADAIASHVRALPAGGPEAVAAFRFLRALLIAATTASWGGPGAGCTLPLSGSTAPSASGAGAGASEQDLPYGGDLQKAMAARDRNAIRILMKARSGASREVTGEKLLQDMAPDLLRAFHMVRLPDGTVVPAEMTVQGGGGGGPALAPPDAAVSEAAVSKARSVQDAPADPAVMGQLVQALSGMRVLMRGASNAPSARDLEAARKLLSGNVGLTEESVRRYCGVVPLAEPAADQVQENLKSWIVNLAGNAVTALFAYTQTAIAMAGSDTAVAEYASSLHHQAVDIFSAAAQAARALQSALPGIKTRLEVLSSRTAQLKSMSAAAGEEGERIVQRVLGDLVRAEDAFAIVQNMLHSTTPNTLPRIQLRSGSVATAVAQAASLLRLWTSASGEREKASAKSKAATYIRDALQFLRNLPSDLTDPLKTRALLASLGIADEYSAPVIHLAGLLQNVWRTLSSLLSSLSEGATAEAGPPPTSEGADAAAEEEAEVVAVEAGAAESAPGLSPAQGPAGAGEQLRKRQREEVAEGVTTSASRRRVRYSERREADVELFDRLLESAAEAAPASAADEQEARDRDERARRERQEYQNALSEQAARELEAQQQAELQREREREERLGEQAARDLERRQREEEERLSREVAMQIEQEGAAAAAAASDFDLEMAMLLQTELQGATGGVTDRDAELARRLQAEDFGQLSAGTPGSAAASASARTAAAARSSLPPSGVAVGTAASGSGSGSGPGSGSGSAGAASHSEGAGARPQEARARTESDGSPRQRAAQLLSEHIGQITRAPGVTRAVIRLCEATSSPAFRAALDVVRRKLARVVGVDPDSDVARSIARLYLVEHKDMDEEDFDLDT